ncbi:uncharacterized protein LOC122662423 isoform X2 [Telopea speciosissima]|uniref:uncharacterized protein LOC122662423 isoform X2 n=1 Tax=Telopea speciosissima TaxID=54955 RepID=UPI001CC3D618|nr:uncharacterized protein LOC122662423 isoform X2 [Telopea speciosissima]
MACSSGGEYPLTSSSSPFPSQSPPTNRRGRHSVAFSSLAFQKTMTRRKNSSHPTTLLELAQPTTKKANLSARRKESIKLPNYVDGHGRIYPISEFLSHPSGVEAILNTRALQSFESVDLKTYRCSLPKIQLLKFEVAPVLDLRVTATNEDCTVEMLSCKFQGSEAVERQNDHFSAFMINHIKWDANGSEPSLDVDVKLNLTLEINTLPFTLLPISAVENPGNLIMQTLVDKLVPMLLEQLLQDYEKWVQEQCEISP